MSRCLQTVACRTRVSSYWVLWQLCSMIWRVWKNLWGLKYSNSIEGAGVGVFPLSTDATQYTIVPTTRIEKVTEAIHQLLLHQLRLVINEVIFTLGVWGLGSLALSFTMQTHCAAVVLYWMCAVNNDQSPWMTLKEESYITVYNNQLHIHLAWNHLSAEM